MMGQTALTQQQARALGFIRQFSGEKGFAPSYDEIGAHIGTGKSAVHRIVGALEERGCVHRIPGKSRAIEIIFPRAINLNPEIFSLMRDYAHKHSISIETAANEALRQWLGVAG